MQLLNAVAATQVLSIIKTSTTGEIAALAKPMLTARFEAVTDLNELVQERRLTYQGALAAPARIAAAKTSTQALDLRPL
ncbi:MAG: hypothetical protein DI551_12125 [Micavibrio aeruginosavorus]|uniref:Uncharacterized protein n=1 Tax=Micavibrio aeruginosavorus TaxID=349221 RepID=A0A2W5MSL8_9BACT|nr:MAG: hypothetical protein DI551_12125 [Micavibrio aeruginosavorus]